MNAFRQTSLSINGRIFSEDNTYRDILDACYRGVGAQAYGAVSYTHLTLPTICSV